MDGDDHSDDRADSRARSSWLTFGLPAGVAAILVSLVVYAVSVGHDIGAMRQQQHLNVQRLDALEERGSGPVQQSAERMLQLQARVDRMLNELLELQKRLGDLTAQVARQDEVMKQLREDRKP
jgi:hypothetical protein